jgi:uncharacterized membrane protein YkoI
MPIWRHVLLALLAVPPLTAAAAPPAQPAMSTQQRPMPAADSEITMDQAVRLVEQKYRARVVKAESQRDNGRTVYVLRLLDDSGKVWTVHVDAASGTVRP